MRIITAGECTKKAHTNVVVRKKRQNRGLTWNLRRESDGNLKSYEFNERKRKKEMSFSVESRCSSHQKKEFTKKRKTRSWAERCGRTLVKEVGLKSGLATLPGGVSKKQGEDVSRRLKKRGDLPAHKEKKTTKTQLGKTKYDRLTEKKVRPGRGMES